MAMNTVINTNMMALTAHRNLASVGNRQNKASQRLSSGKKINSAADDAAGLAISEKMKAQIKGLDMASKNSEDAISLIQTAEGSLTEVNDMLTRVRELTVQAANDTNQKEDREKIGEEVAALLTEIDSISERTEFNEKKLNDGSFKDGFFQIGSNAGQKLDVSIGNMDVKSLGLDEVKSAFGVTGGKTGAYIDGVEVRKKDGSVVGPQTIDAKAAESKFKVAQNGAGGLPGAADTVDVSLDYKDADGKVHQVVLKGVKGGASADAIAGNIVDAINNNDELGKIFTATKGNNGELTLKALETGDTGIQITGVNFENPSSANKNLKLDAGITNTPGNDAGSKFDLATDFQAGSSITVNGKTYNMVANGGTKIGENEFTDVAGLTKLLEKDGIMLEKVDGNNYAFKEKGSGYIVNTSATSDDGKVYSNAIANVDKALKTVTTQRSKLGANQNRLEHTINNLNLSSENLSAAKSRIEDTDMAKEMMNLTSANVLQQAATSMLAQANQAPNKITQLLG